jgi:hypothetical protein
MLLKVTAVIETVVCVDEENFIKACVQAQKAIEDNEFEPIKEDLINTMECAIGFREIESVNHLPEGWDKTCVPWGDGSEGRTIATLLNPKDKCDCQCCEGHGNEN